MSLVFINNDYDDDIIITMISVSIWTITRSLDVLKIIALLVFAAVHTHKESIINVDTECSRGILKYWDKIS